jgi:hypothetical protein
MAEEIFYAPLANAPVLTLESLISHCTTSGLRAQLQVDSSDMCWVHFEGLNSQFVVSTSPDELKEVGLVTFEFVANDGEAVLIRLSSLLESIGLSSDPDAQYR